MTLKRFIFYCAAAGAAVYCGITSYPGVFFGGVYSHNNVSLYVKEPVSANVEELLARVHEKISSDDFFESGRRFEVYLAAGPKEYLFWAPFCGRRTACLHPLSGKIFINYSDPGNNRVCDPGWNGICRGLDDVMVHELVKAQLKSRMGPLTYAFVADWKKDGYAEHVAQETRDTQTSEICREDADKDSLGRLLKYRLMVEMLASEDDLDYPSLMRSKRSYESVRARLFKRYCGK